MAAGKQEKRFTPSGVLSDLPPLAVPDEFYTAARDIVFRDSAERVGGLETLFGVPLFPPSHLVFSFDATEAPVWLYPGVAGIGVYREPLHSDITPLSFNSPTRVNPWTSGLLNGVPVINNISSVPWFWGRDVAVAMQDLPDWPANRRAGFMRPYKFHLIAGNIDEAGVLLQDQVLFSDAAPPGSIPQFWTPAPDNQAGSTELSYTGGEVIDGLPLRGSFIIYKDTSTYVMDFVGGSQVMQQRLLFPEIGMLTRNCGAALGNAHYILTDGDVIRHDGQVVKSIADGVVRRAIFDNVSGENIRNAFVVSDAAEGEVWFCMALEGSVFPNVAFIYNVLRDRWSARDLLEEPQHIAVGSYRLTVADESWDADPEAWDVDNTSWDSGGPRVDFYQLLEGVPDPAPGSFEAVDGQFSRNGEPVTAELRKEKIRLAGPSQVTLVKAVWLETRGTPGSELLVSVAGTLAEGESDVYGPEVSYIIGTDEKVDVYSLGRFHSVRIRSDDPLLPAPWELAAWRLEYEVRGLY